MPATIVEVELSADEFALSHTLSSVEGVKFEIERVVAHEDDRVMPFVWVSGGDIDRDEFEAILTEDPSLDQLELLADVDDEWLYQMEWVSEIETLVQILVTEEATILAATGNQDSWNLRTLFPDRDALSRTHDYCQEKGLPFEILNIYQLDEGRQGRFGITEDQQEALTRAYDSGYYNIPRKATAEEIADELGVSHQALSERLRRGHGSLVKNALIIGRGADEREKN
ncbi:bacterio-opsin activator domain-containing protein [Haladaptatus halobius]|uniref:bacterio-opsin activator domain-containing protein n=1 Tax=Haladaptatus halobius TaxID=2884875 RepID=UPI001D0AB530|nr:bacterio-opsin activator domain-containing protein [Haladaptatus halobius]